MTQTPVSGRTLQFSFYRIAFTFSEYKDRRRQLTLSIRGDAVHVVALGDPDLAEDGAGIDLLTLTTVTQNSTEVSSGLQIVRGEVRCRVWWHIFEEGFAFDEPCVAKSPEANRFANQEVVSVLPPGLHGRNEVLC